MVLHGGEEQAYEEIAPPIAHAAQGHGAWPGPHLKQLRADEVGDGTHSQAVAYHKSQHADDTDVRHPRVRLLELQRRQRKIVILLCKKYLQ